jgi:hypothetical protein
MLHVKNPEYSGLANVSGVAVLIISILTFLPCILDYCMLDQLIYYLLLIKCCARDEAPGALTFKVSEVGNGLALSLAI